MNRQSDHATPSRTGMRRVIPPWEFRHLRLWAGLRIGGAVVSIMCSLLTLGLGGTGEKTYTWAALFLAVGALALTGGLWELTIARSVSAET